MKGPSLFRIFGQLAHPATRPLYSIPTHLTDREKLRLMALARDRERAAGRPINVVEIGAYLGASTCFLASGLQHPGSRVLSVDTWANDAMTEGARDTMAQFLANTSSLGDRIVPFRGFSHDMGTVEKVRASAGTIDLLFVDGDHAYEGVKRDWDSYAPLLAEGAVIAMHDFGWAEGVQRVVSEQIAPATRRHGSLKNLWWGTLRR